MSVLPLDLSSLIAKLSDRQLELLSRDNPDARMETNSNQRAEKKVSSY